MAKVIAEIGINHNGQMHLAKQLIEVAARCKADYAKFQRRTVPIVYAGQLDKPRDDGNHYGWETVGEQKAGLEFSLEQYEEIDEHCSRVGIDWFCSCWDIPVLKETHALFDLPFVKVASAMVTHDEFIEEVANLGLPTIISTGGCTMTQIDKAMDALKRGAPEIILMHCVAMYPCPDNYLDLNMLHILRERYPYATIGYSGHEVGIYPSVMAAAMGAKYIERHLTIDRSMYGSDQAASMEERGMQQLCDVVHDVEMILGTGIKRVHAKERDCMLKLRYWE